MTLAYCLPPWITYVNLVVALGLLWSGVSLIRSARVIGATRKMSAENLEATAQILADARTMRERVLEDIRRNGGFAWNNFHARGDKPEHEGESGIGRDG